MRRKTLRTLLAALLIASTLSATAFAETALVTGSEVNVRSGPGSDYAILGSCTRGSTVDVIDRGDGTWYAVNYNGSVGYMFSQYLSLQSSGSGGASAVPGQAVISDGDLSLEDYQLSESSTIWYQNSAGEYQELVTLAGQYKRIWVDYEDIPKYMEQRHGSSG